MPVAIALIIFAACYRVLATIDQSLANISPIMAIALCSAVYFRNRWMWLVPFVAVGLSDAYINHYYAKEYGFTWPVSGYVARSVCIVALLLIGAWVARRKSWLNLLYGSLLGAIIFYVVTNTQSWAADTFYAKTLAGWWQAMTIGHPEYQPTIYFFRKTLFGDLMFTGLFAGVMEWLAQRKGEPSLLDDEEESETEETEPEEKPVEAEAKE